MGCGSTLGLLGVVMPSSGQDMRPRGSKYPIFADPDPQNHALNGFWDKSPQILGTGTLWESIQGRLPELNAMAFVEFSIMLSGASKSSLADSMRLTAQGSAPLVFLVFSAGLEA